MKNSIDELYIDQAPVRRLLERDRTFSATYTSHGIRLLDSKYCKMIQNMPTKAYADKLRREIKANPHLHEEIKENLLLNLREYRKNIGPESLARYNAIEAKKPFKDRKVRVKNGHNKNMTGIVVWSDEGNLGIGRIGVKGDSKEFRNSLYFDYACYDWADVEVIP